MATIDGDAHVMEGPQTWEYCDPAERKFMPVLVNPGEHADRQFWLIDGKIRGHVRHVIKPKGAATVSFTITGISLDENTSYWLAIRNTTGREFGWTTTYRDGQSSPGAWTIDDSADATSQSTGAT